MTTTVKEPHDILCDAPPWTPYAPHECRKCEKAKSARQILAQQISEKEKATMDGERQRIVQEIIELILNGNPT